MRTVAPQVLDKDVGGVGLGGEAVVADVDAGICDSQAIHVQRVEAIGVLGERGGIRRHSVDVDVVKDDVLGTD